MARRDLVVGEHDEDWFPPGGAPPATVSPTRPLGRKPASITEGLLDRARPKSSGVVRLPVHVAWSPPYEYDLADRRGRVAAYQRVMTEGLDEDVLHFIDVDQVVDMWDELHLSPHIRAPWERWLRSHGLLDPEPGRAPGVLSTPRCASRPD